MGSWDGTCGISQVAISSGTKVKMVIIQNAATMPEASGFCYSMGYASPISFVIEGEYNDYGGVNCIDKTSNSVKTFLTFFREELMTGKIKVTPDKYYDNEDFGSKTIDYTTLGIEKVVKLLERDRVSIKTNYYREHMETTYVNLGIQIFQSSIVDSIMSHIYNDEGDWDNKTITRDKMEKEMLYASEDLFKDEMDKMLLIEISNIKESIKKMTGEKEIKKAKEAIEIIKGLSQHSSSSGGFSKAIRKEGNYSNRIRILSSMDMVNSNAFFNYFNIIAKMEDRDNEKLAKMFQDMVELILVMTAVRERWSSQTGKGSQSFNEAAYIGLTEGIKESVYGRRDCVPGEQTYCCERFTYEGFTYEEDEEYVVESCDLLNDKIKIEGMGVLTWSKYEGYFEN